MPAIIETLTIVTLTVLPIFMLWFLVSDILGTEYMIKRKRQKKHLAHCAKHGIDSRDCKYE